jgi:ATP-dependent DNA ligase
MSENEAVVYPPLYGKTSTGKTKVWYARVLTNSSGHGISEIRHGQKDGALQTTLRVVETGKNIGKKNETTPLNQAISETKRKWVDKKDKEGYVEDESQLDAKEQDSGAEKETAIISATIYPMLAKVYDSKKTSKNGITFPCFVQPKLDGLRCVMYKGVTGKIVAQSRTGGVFEFMDHIIGEVACILNNNPNLILDGELYTTEIPFENLAGLIKKKHASSEDLKQIQLIDYHVYDLIDLQNASIKFSERTSFLNFLVKSSFKHVKFVKTCSVPSHAEFYEKFQEFIAEGYEGAMLRNSNGLYKQNNRSSDLQKYKEFQEEEYKIVGFTQGEGRDEGTVIWICEIADGTKFNVRPRGTVEHRKELFNNAPNSIGSALTVIFQELSKFGVPRFPVGKSIRYGF